MKHEKRKQKHEQQIETRKTASIAEDEELEQSLPKNQKNQTKKETASKLQTERQRRIPTHRAWPQKNPHPHSILSLSLKASIMSRRSPPRPIVSFSGNVTMDMSVDRSPRRRATVTVLGPSESTTWRLRRIPPPRAKSDRSFHSDRPIKIGDISSETDDG